MKVPKIEAEGQSKATNPHNKVIKNLKKSHGIFDNKIVEPTHMVECQIKRNVCMVRAPLGRTKGGECAYRFVRSRMCLQNGKISNGIR
jgi:hypothetical protein